MQHPQIFCGLFQDHTRSNFLINNTDPATSCANKNTNTIYMDNTKVNFVKRGIGIDVLPL